MIVVTDAELKQFRERLTKAYPKSLSAFDVIQECEYHLSDAAKVIAIRQNIKDDVMSRSDWFCSTLKEYKVFVDKSKYGYLTTHDLLDMMASLIKFLTEYLSCTIATATVIAVPFAIYITKEIQE